MCDKFVGTNRNDMIRKMLVSGLTLSTAMANAGLTTFDKIEQTNPRDLELVW